MKLQRAIRRGRWSGDPAGQHGGVREDVGGVGGLLTMWALFNS